MRTCFDSIVDIQEFTNDDLVAYAKGYAREQEYSIDEMGILAIYNRVGDLQTIDHVVSLDEMEDIIDGAIRHVDRKNVSHFMDVILAKRYDEEDMIKFLKEKGVEWQEVDVDAFTKACAPVYDWIVEEYKADPTLHDKLVSELTAFRNKK